MSKVKSEAGVLGKTSFFVVVVALVTIILVAAASLSRGRSPRLVAPATLPAACSKRYLVLVGDLQNQFNNQLDSIWAALALCARTGRTCVLHGMSQTMKVPRYSEGADYWHSKKWRVPFSRYFDTVAMRRVYGDTLIDATEFAKLANPQTGRCGGRCFRADFHVFRKHWEKADKKEDKPRTLVNEGHAGDADLILTPNIDPADPGNCPEPCLCPDPCPFSSLQLCGVNIYRHGSASPKRHGAIGASNSTQVVFVQWPAFEVQDDVVGITKAEKERWHAAFQWNGRVTSAADAFLQHSTQGRPFLAVHVRRGVSAWMQQGPTAKQVVSQMEASWPMRAPFADVVVASNLMTPTELAQWKQATARKGWVLHHYNPSGDVPGDIVSAIEMAICERSTYFYGSRGSTWSWHVVMRGDFSEGHVFNGPPDS